MVFSSSTAAVSEPSRTAGADLTWLSRFGIVHACHALAAHRGMTCISVLVWPCQQTLVDSDLSFCINVHGLLLIFFYRMKQVKKQVKMNEVDQPSSENR
jgi:hypothetical protein